MDDGFIGEIRIVPWNWAPEGWLLCMGQRLPISQYQALFAIIGYSFGKQNDDFMLPNLMGRSIAGAGQSTGLTNRVFAEAYGTEIVALTTNQIPTHNHTLLAGANSASLSDYVNTPTSNSYIGHDVSTGAKSYTTAVTPLVSMSPTAISSVGTSTPHENRQPFLVMNYIICYDGEFPLRP